MEVLGHRDAREYSKRIASNRRKGLIEHGNKAFLRQAVRKLLRYLHVNHKRRCLHASHDASKEASARARMDAA